MAVSIDWATKVITVPQADLTLVTGTLYELDTDAFRLELKSLEDSEEGMPFPATHRHNTEVTVAGVTFARTIEIINGYSITFEDGAYSVRLAGSNNNFFDVENGILNQNTVQVIAQNSAGLIVYGGAASPWIAEIEPGYTAEELIRLIAAAVLGKVDGAATPTITFRDVNDTTDRIVADVDGDGNRTDVTLDPA